MSLGNILCELYEQTDYTLYKEVEEDLKVYVIACTGKDKHDMYLDCSLHV